VNDNTLKNKANEPATTQKVLNNNRMIAVIIIQ